MREGGSVNTSSIDDFREERSVESMSDFFIETPTRSFESWERILSTTSRATLFSRRVISNSGKSSSNCSWVIFELESFVFSFEKKPCSFGVISSVGDSVIFSWKFFGEVVIAESCLGG